MSLTVGSLLAAALRRGGDRTALRHGPIQRTHAELLGNAARLANALAGMGLRPGDHVAIMAADRAEAVEAYLGCLIGGFPAIHVNDRLRSRELEPILAEADARGFVYTDSVAPQVEALGGWAPGTSVIGIGDDLAGRHLRWADVLAAARPDVPAVPRGPEDLTIVGYTSGTTGQPKGVMHNQRTMTRIIQHMPVHFDMRPRSRCAFTGTLSFVAGIWGVLLPTLFLGGEVSFMAGLAPDEWFDRMVAERSQLTYVPTPLAGAFVEQVHRRPELLGTLRVAMHSGSKMPAVTVRAVVDAVGPRFAESYGMTETGAPVTRTEDGDWTSGEAADVFASAGRAVHIADLAIVDDDDNPLPPGSVGEISVAGDTLFAGYYRRPDLTAESVINGRLRTGDVGWMDDAGFLYVTDRSKDMIVTGGMNVYPAEVEGALADLPGLAEIAVIGVPHDRWGETVVAVAVVSDPALGEAAIIQAARDRIASYKKPTEVRFVREMPRTASLKIDKPALRRQWETLTTVVSEE